MCQIYYDDWGGGGGGGEGGIDSIVLSADSLPLKLNQFSLSEVRFSMELCKEDLPINIFKSVEGIFKSDVTGGGGGGGGGVCVWKD